MISFIAQIDCLVFVMRWIISTTKDNGNFADIDDHLIDCFCYAIAGFHYCFVEGAKSNILLPRNRILDINSFRENNSWTSNIEGLENEPDYFTDIH
jgi:hypothetical protein